LETGRNQGIQETVKPLSERFCSDDRGHNALCHLFRTGGEATEQDAQDIIVDDGNTTWKRKRKEGPESWQRQKEFINAGTSIGLPMLALMGR
jgi:hypothetical protein